MAITAIPTWRIPSYPVGAINTHVLDAAGESASIVGQVEFQAGASGSKTISAAGGGALVIRTGGSVVFADAGSTVRIGLQDVDTVTTGLEDGTFDVYADLVGGTDTIGSTVFLSVPMEAGTKTIAAGDVVAIVIELTSRGGSDSIRPAYGSSWPAQSPQHASVYPYSTADSGTLAKGNVPIIAGILCDDDTVGWIRGANILVPSASYANVNFSSTTSPDEYIGTFQPFAPMQVSGIGIPLSGVAASGEAPQIILYSDPYGTTPTALATVTINPPTIHATGSQGFATVAITPTTLSPSTVYGVAVRAVETGTITTHYLNLGTGLGWIKNAWPFGSSLKWAGRSDGTGAFAEVEPHYAPFITLDVCGLDDGAGTGGATARRGNMLGAFRV